jgi:hypothetical protein
MKKVMDFDPNTGIKHVFHYDNLTDEASITAEQDVDHIIEQNKQLINEAPDRWGEWTRVAQIPMVVYLDLQKKGILNDQAALKRWLNDPDNKFFRTKAGTI